MKMMKRMISAVAAICMSLMSIPAGGIVPGSDVLLPVAAGSSESITLSADQVEVDISDIGKPIPIYVRSSDTKYGYTELEFGVNLPQNCSTDVITGFRDAYTLGGEPLDCDSLMSIAKNRDFLWHAEASADPICGSANLVLYMVTLPSTAKVGDKFPICFSTKNGSGKEAALCKNQLNSCEYQINTVDGYIVVTGEVPTEPPAASSDDTVTISIDRKQVDISDIRKPVPIYIRTSESVRGFTDYEFGVKMPQNCEYSIITDSIDAEELGGEYLSRDVTIQPGNHFMWITDANSHSMTKAMRLVLLMVTLPSTAKVGDVFPIQFSSKNGSGKEAAFCKDQHQSLSYNLKGIDGYIEVTGTETDGEITISIDKKQVDLSDIKKPVPVYVRCSDTPKGFTDIEFGVQLPKNCTYSIINDSSKAAKQGGEYLSRRMTFADQNGFTWNADASAHSEKGEKNLLLYMVTLPSNAKVGDKFPIKFSSKNGSGTEAAFCKNQLEGVSYDVLGVDGYIEVTTNSEITYTVDQKQVNISAINDYVPVFVRCSDTVYGFTDMEFGIQMPQNCDYYIVTSPRESLSLTNELLDVKMTSLSNRQFIWNCYADQDALRGPMNLILYMVKLPQTAKVGDKFPIKFSTKNGSGKDAAFCANQFQSLRYNIKSVDGYIEVTGPKSDGEITISADQVEVDISKINEPVPVYIRTSGTPKGFTDLEFDVEFEKGTIFTAVTNSNVAKNMGGEALGCKTTVSPDSSTGGGSTWNCVASDTSLKNSMNLVLYMVNLSPDVKIGDEFCIEVSTYNANDKDAVFCKDHIQGLQYDVHCENGYIRITGEDDPEISEAVDCVLDNFSDWAHDEQGNSLLNTNEAYYVGFLDLDLDGTLEFVVESCQGTGHYTYMNAYWIGKNSLVQIPVADSEYFPDLGDHMLRLCRNKNGEICYYGEDYRKAGAQYHDTTFCRLSYKLMQDCITVTPFYTAAEEYNWDTEEMENSYYDALSGDKISRKSYELLKSKTLAGLTDLNLNYLFIPISDVLEENARRELMNAYKAFSYNGKSENGNADNACGEDAYWSFDKVTGTLTISGTGAVTDHGWVDEGAVYFDENGRSNLRRIVVGEGITALYNAPNVGFDLREIQLPSTLTFIDDMYFACFSDGGYDVDDPNGAPVMVLQEVEIPPSVTFIGENAFNTQLCCDGTIITYYDDFTIKSESGTIAENYAAANNIDFVELILSKMIGDVDGDGHLGILDVITLNRSLMIGEKLSAQAKINADVDRSGGNPDETDALNILKAVVELITLPM